MNTWTTAITVYTVYICMIHLYKNKWKWSFQKKGTSISLGAMHKVVVSKKEKGLLCLLKKLLLACISRTRVMSWRKHDKKSKKAGKLLAFNRICMESRLGHSYMMMFPLKCIGKNQHKNDLNFLLYCCALAPKTNHQMLLYHESNYQVCL